MSRTLNVLLVDNDAAASERLAGELEGEGLAIRMRRVASAEALRAALTPAVDVVLSEYRLPELQGLDVLRLLEEEQIGAPVIFVAQDLTEDEARAALGAGAADYLLKDRLARLGPAVRRALEPRQLLEERRERLIESETRWRMLLEQLPDPLTISVGDRWVYVNEAWARLLGAADRQSLAGRTMAEFTTPDFHEGLRRHLGGRCAPADSPFECQVVRLDGSEISVEVVSVPVVYEGRPAVQSVVRDVTERKRYVGALIEAKERAEEMATLKSSLLSNLSHEIRTPLTSIIGFAELLLEDTGGEQRQFVELIQKAGHRLFGMLNALLDLARLDTGGVRLRPQPMDLARRVRETVDLFRPLAEAKGLSLNVSSARLGRVVRLDPGCLDRILNHLVENAIKFTEAGEVSVDVLVTDEHAEIRVRDTGIGIGSQFLPHVFEEFRQESFGHGRDFEGLGLGLTITKRLVSRMGGELSVSSEKGRGSVFCVRLPFGATAARTEERPARLPEIWTATEKRRILVVEGSAETRRLLYSVQQSGYEVDLASGSEDALRQASRCVYNAVLLDVSGDDGAARALAADLRRLRGYEHVPLVACAPEHRDDAAARAAGFDGFLARPFTREQLLRIVDDVLQPAM